MRTLLETVRTELERDGSGVHVCAVLPDAINTPQFDRDRQTTGEPKPTGAPDNPDAPLPGDRGARGRFDELARASSRWTEARLRLGKTGSVAALTALPLAALGAAAIGYHGITKRG